MKFGLFWIKNESILIGDGQEYNHQIFMRVKYKLNDKMFSKFFRNDLSTIFTNEKEAGNGQF